MVYVYGWKENYIVFGKILVSAGCLFIYLVFPFETFTVWL